MPYKDKQKQLEAQRQHYKQHKDDYKFRRSAYRERNRRFLYRVKSMRGCEVCRESHPATLSFHHIDRQHKDGVLAEAVGARWSLARLKQEVRKCQVLCQNCHSKKHYEEGHMPALRALHERYHT